MCGISGYLGKGSTQLLEQMAAALHHRGPDGQGIWEDVDANVGFSHRRLSIVDLSESGSQPMTSLDGRVTLCYNGELYDFKEHRKSLQALGYKFRGSSDTEVVLNLYHHYGTRFLERVNGIFSLAIWDAEKHRLLLIRDNMGVKPLYYRQTASGLYFASEIKALLKSQSHPPEICKEALEAYLSFLYVPGDLTLFNGIRKLEPGTYATIQSGQFKTQRWFQPDYEPDFSLSESEWVEQLKAEFDAAVERQLIADVKVGAFLSGGVDSSAIAATACRHISPSDLQCFTVSYPPDDVAAEGIQSDLPYAKKIAKTLGLNLHVSNVGPDAITLLPEVVRAVEEPDADMTSIVTHILSRAAKQAGATVLLSGTGGDEVFYGYRTHLAYRHFSRIPRILHAPVSRILHTTRALSSPFLSASSPLARRADRYANALPLRGFRRHLAIANSSASAGDTMADMLNTDFRETLPGSQYLANTFKHYANVLSPNSEEAAVHSWLLTQTFLADHNFLYADKCGMANSIEIRVPFMDRKLMKLAASVPAGQHMAGGVTKNLLKKAMADVLDPGVINRPKVGFNPPIRTWIAEERSALSRELLSDDVTRSRGFFDPTAVNKLRASTRAGLTDGAQFLFAIQYLELWCREFIDGGHT